MFQFDLIADRGAQSIVKNGLSKTEHFRVLSGESTRFPPIDYEENAIVPGRSWANASVNFAHQPTENRPFIFLVDARSAVKALWSLECVTKENIISTRKNEAIVLWYDELFSHYIRERWGEVLESQYIGAYSKQPNLDTTTVSYKTGKRIGIHIDAWERWHWSQAINAKYRLCMNIGFSDRFFIFADKTTSQFVKTVKNLPDAHKTGNRKNLTGGTEYFRQYASKVGISFYRIRIPPGFGYVAPTDFIYHDGSTVGIIDHTAQFTVRGFFQLAKREWWIDDIG